jgi:hypothetical protein
MRQKDICPKCKYSADVTFGILGVCVRCGAHPLEYRMEVLKIEASRSAEACIAIIDQVISETDETQRQPLGIARERIFEKVINKA